jgi:HAD superfamily hydrolase (TIGR01509 family)
VINGVLFDFSGTLFHFEPDIDGQPLDRTQLIETLTSPITPNLPSDMLEAWDRRDLDPVIHRRVYLSALTTAHPGVATDVLESVYELVPQPRFWMPYPDTAPALRGLRAAGIPVGVVSNIPWNVRAVFERNGVAELVDEFVLSYEEGVMKPDPAIFRTACRRIGTAPENTLMIGDSEEADGGATAIGCAFVTVARVPPGERPSALVEALAAHGVPITGYEP